MDADGTPRDGRRFAVLDNYTQASMTPGFVGLFNPQASISRNYETGLLTKNFFGYDTYMSQNLPTHVNAVLAGTPLFDATGTSTAIMSSGWAEFGTLATKGWTNNAVVLNVGDVFTINTVFMANPQNRSTQPRLRQFVVQPPVTGATPAAGTYTSTAVDGAGNSIDGFYTASGSGTLQLTIAPCLIYAGQFKNCSSQPANNAPITLYSATAQTSPQSLLFHKDAYTLVNADLVMPTGVEFALRASDKATGLSYRIVRQYTVNNDALPTRLDMLFGVKRLQIELAARMHGG
jgi:hypothetical protein